MVGRRRSSYIFKIDTDESNKSLLQKIRQFVQSKKLDVSEKRPWQGFLYDEKKNIIFEANPGYYYTKYGFEIKLPVQLFNNQEYINYLPEIVPVLFSIEKKYIVINSSLSTPRTIVSDALKYHLEDTNYIRIQRVIYPPDFLKWLIENGSRGKHPLFNRINWVKIDELTTYDPYTTDVAIGSDEQVRDSDVYKRVGGKGRHVSLSGFINIDKQIIKARLYSWGQMTLSAEYPDYGTYVFELAEELDRLRTVSGIK